MGGLQIFDIMGAVFHIFEKFDIMPFVVFDGRHGGCRHRIGVCCGATVTLM